jgi:hypothetical protein
MHNTVFDILEASRLRASGETVLVAFLKTGVYALDGYIVIDNFVRFGEELSRIYETSISKITIVPISLGVITQVGDSIIYIKRLHGAFEVWELENLRDGDVTLETLDKDFFAHRVVVVGDRMVCPIEDGPGVDITLRYFLE